MIFGPAWQWWGDGEKWLSSRYYFVAIADRTSDTKEVEWEWESEVKDDTKALGLGFERMNLTLIEMGKTWGSVILEDSCKHERIQGSKHLKALSD